MKYYDEIKERLIDNEIYSKVKDYSKERNRLKTYFEVGKLLSEAGKHYGKNIIEEYSKKLIIDVGKKYDKSTLFRIKKFYLIFSNKKVVPVVPQLTWSHCLLLIPMKDFNKINYYITQISKRNLSKRKLEELIKNKDYERLPGYTKTKFINYEEKNISNFVKNPIIIKNPNNHLVASEKLLQKLILENISSFLEELGDGFTFIKNEYKIKIGNNNNYIDLLLFNIEFNCYVVVELKVVELKKEHIGQIEIYMNYIDKNIKKISHDKTIGLIICKKDNEFIIEYSSDKRIIARYYEIR